MYLHHTTHCFQLVSSYGGGSSGPTADVVLHREEIGVLSIRSRNLMPNSSAFSTVRDNKL